MECWRISLINLNLTKRKMIIYISNVLLRFLVISKELSSFKMGMVSSVVLF